MNADAWNHDVISKDKVACLIPLSLCCLPINCLRFIGNVYPKDNLHHSSHQRTCHILTSIKNVPIRKREEKEYHREEREQDYECCNIDYPNPYRRLNRNRIGAIVRRYKASIGLHRYNQSPRFISAFSYPDHSCSSVSLSSPALLCYPASPAWIA